MRALTVVVRRQVEPPSLATVQCDIAPALSTRLYSCHSDSQPSPARVYSTTVFQLAFNRYNFCRLISFFSNAECLQQLIYQLFSANFDKNVRSVFEVKTQQTAQRFAAL